MTKQLSFLVLFAWFFAVTNASSNNNHIKMIAATSNPTSKPILLLLAPAPYRSRSSSFVFSWLPFDPVENFNEIIILSVKNWSFILFSIWRLHKLEYQLYFISISPAIFFHFLSFVWLSWIVFIMKTSYR